MVVVFFRFFGYRDHASVGDFADRVFELDCGVGDPEIMLQAVFYVAQDAFAD